MKFLLALSILTATVVKAQDACTTESAALATNTGLTAEYTNMGAAIQKDVTDNFLGFCNIAQLACSVDADAYDDTFITLCTDAGGKIYTESVTAGCSGSLGNFPIPAGLTFSVNNWPICVGGSCDVNMLPQAVTDGIDTAVETVIDEIEAGLGGTVMCDIQASSGTGSAGPATTAAGSAMTTAAGGATGSTEAPPTTMAGTGTTEEPMTTVEPTSSAAAAGMFGAVLGAAGIIMI